MAEEIRHLIRSILAEELASLKTGQALEDKHPPREQLVSVSTGHELTEFVNKLLDMFRDNRTRADIESGRLVFRLKQGSPSDSSAYRSSAASGPVRGGVIQFEKGIITEKQIQSMSEHVKVIKIGNSVRITPLAKDAVRHAGITIEKVKT